MQVQNMFSRIALIGIIIQRPFVLCARIILLAAVLCLVGNPALAGSCTKTSWAAFVACQNEARDDYWIARGNCYNLSDSEAQAECFKDALSEFREAVEECKDQREARLEVCEDIGEAPYDPVIDPADFVDPTEIGDGVDPNPYFPLVQGYRWEYENESADETISDEVTYEIKEILGVQCAVVHDVVAVENDEGDLVVIEDTKDWYAQDLAGNVWYFGEIAQEFDEEDGELVSIDGSWKGGEEGAKPGIIMWAEPEERKVYRQEFALGEAEDMGEVISLEASAAVPAPAASCSEDCLKTKDFTPIEPGVLEHKFYKLGVGLILEVDPETGERVELTSFTQP